MLMKGTVISRQHSDSLPRGLPWHFTPTPKISHPWQSITPCKPFQQPDHHRHCWPGHTNRPVVKRDVPSGCILGQRVPRGVENQVKGDRDDVRHFLGIGEEPDGLLHNSHHRCDLVAGLTVIVRKLPKHLDVVGRETNLFLRFPKRCINCRPVNRVDVSTRKADVAAKPDVVLAARQDQAGLGARTYQHQHSRGARVCPGCCGYGWLRVRIPDFARVARRVEPRPHHVNVYVPQP